MSPPDPQPTEARPAPGPSAALGGWIGIAGSIALHAGAIAWLTWSVTTPSLGIQFQLPTEIEFGLTEGMEVAPAATPTTPPATPPATGEATAGSGLGAGDGGARDLDAGTRRRRPRDAGPGEGGVDRDAGVARDAGPALVASAAGSGTGGTDSGRAMGEYAPPGAQLALRIDMERIRRSPLAPDVRHFLAAFPDWRAIIEGSEIDPVDNLARVFIASPNLQRSRMVMAGRYEGDATQVRAAVARLALARGEPAEWRDEAGIEVAPWRNADPTERVIALTGPQQFTITRPDDLPRVLAVARARAARAGHPPEPGDPGDGLLDMGEGEALSLEIEGAHQFVRGDPRFVPTRAHLAMREQEGAMIGVEVQGYFPNDADAIAARDFWEGQREAYARHFLIALMGFAQPLREGTLETQGSSLFFRTRLTPRQLRGILRRIEALVAPPPEDTESTSAPVGGAAPPRTVPSAPAAPGAPR